jgi:two-component system, LytTR family, response regulator
MKVMIVDDETLALNRLKRLLNEANIDDITVFNNPKEAHLCALNESFDVVFLDISMPQMSGLELANAILQHTPKTFIVFQTAYEEFALDAFKSGGMGYLLKPIERQMIVDIIEKIRLYLGNTQIAEQKIVAKSFDAIHLIRVDDICFIQASLDEVIIQTAQKEVYAKKKIGELEVFLKNKNFFRVHRSYLVNVDKIKSMQSIEQSKLIFFFEGTDKVVVSSKEGAKEFRDYLQQQTV